MEDIGVIVDAWCDWVGDDAGIQASRVSPATTRGGTAFVEYVGPLRAADGRNIKIDVAIDEVVRDGSERRALLSEYSDLEGGLFLIDVYGVAEIWAEKARSLMQHDLLARLDGRQKTWQRLWQQRLGNQVRDLPDFDGVWRRVIRGLRQADY